MGWGFGFGKKRLEGEEELESREFCPGGTEVFWAWIKGSFSSTYTSAVGTVALIAYGTFTDDGTVGVGVVVAGDVAGASSAVGDGLSGHFFEGFFTLGEGRKERSPEFAVQKW